MKHILVKIKKIFFKDLVKNKSLILFILLLVFIIFEIFILFKINFTNVFFGNWFSLNNSTFTKYADKIIKECADSTYRPGCYDKQIPKLMDYISMEDAFEVTAIVQNKDSSYPYCHVLAHELSAR